MSQVSPYIEGDIVSFSCDDGFALNGADNLECLPTGSWDRTVPTCVGKIKKNSFNILLQSILIIILSEANL